MTEYKKIRVSCNHFPVKIRRMGNPSAPSPAPSSNLPHGGSEDIQALLAPAYAAFEEGDASRAWLLAREAATALPDSFAAQRLAATAALAADEPQAALEHFASSLRLAPGPMLQSVMWLGIGRARIKLGEFDHALRAFRRGLSITPGFPPIQPWLAVALLNLGRHDEAENAARKALTRNPDEARARLVLGAALLKQDRLAESADILESLRNDPDVGTETRQYLVLQHKISGDLEAALSELRALLDQNPRYIVYAQLAQLISPRDREDPDFQRLARREQELDQTTEIERIDVSFGLAKAYDDLGDIERATRYLREANALEAAREPYTPDSDEALMQRIETIFTAGFIDRYAGLGLASAQPIFIVSLPRSGSTLIEQMIAAHSRVRGGGEMGHLIQIATALSLRWGARGDFPDIAPADAEEDLRQAAMEYKSRTARLTLMHPHFTDKSLRNFMYIGLIHILLPEARIVHIRRHPLATALGLFRQHFANGLRYSYDLDAIARYYRAYARLMQHWRNVVPDGFVEVRYEELVDDPERQLGRVFDYIGLEFEPECLEFYRLRRPVHTASVAQVRGRLDRSGLDRHSRYKELLAPVAEALADDIAAYEAELAAGSGEAVR